MPTPRSPLRRFFSRDGELDRSALLERFRGEMLATARRYSRSEEDAEDAYQRAAEILLKRSPSGTDDELCRWLRTTVKHEALAVGKQRDRLQPIGDTLAEGPDISDTHEHVAQRERTRLGAEALSYLKPQEIRCLTLKAEGTVSSSFLGALGELMSPVVERARSWSPVFF